MLRGSVRSGRRSGRLCRLRRAAVATVGQRPRAPAGAVPARLPWPSCPRDHPHRRRPISTRKRRCGPFTRSTSRAPRPSARWPVPRASSRRCQPALGGGHLGYPAGRHQPAPARRPAGAAGTGLRRGRGARESRARMPTSSRRRHWRRRPRTASSSRTPRPGSRPPARPAWRWSGSPPRTASTSCRADACAASLANVYLGRTDRDFQGRPRLEILVVEA